MQDLVKTIIDYYEEKELTPSELSKELEGIKLKVLDQIVEDEKEYVIKKSGRLQEYDPDKILKSIRNAARDSEVILNTSDMKILSDSILNRMQSIERNVYPTSEIKEYVIDALKKDGYTKVLEAYLAYIE